MNKDMLYLLLIVCVLGCAAPIPAKQPAIKHMAELHRNGSILYVDEFDSRRIVNNKTPEAYTCYKIMFTDDMQRDVKADQERNLYMEYRMGNDWKVVINGDSIAPVLFQPVIGLHKTIKEGILVFELPKGQKPDALVYDDSFGDWQQQIIAFNQNIK